MTTDVSSGLADVPSGLAEPPHNAPTSSDGQVQICGSTAPVSYKAWSQPGQMVSGDVRSVGGVAMLGYLLGAGLKGVCLVAVIIFVLGLVALIRCRREDIPAIVQALASWWRR